MVRSVAVVAARVVVVALDLVARGVAVLREQGLPDVELLVLHLLQLAIVLLLLLLELLSAQLRQLANLLLPRRQYRGKVLQVPSLFQLLDL